VKLAVNDFSDVRSSCVPLLARNTSTKRRSLEFEYPTEILSGEEFATSIIPRMRSPETKSELVSLRSTVISVLDADKAAHVKRHANAAVKIFNTLVIFSRY
jgi:hypothetical protein